MDHGALREARRSLTPKIPLVYWGRKITGGVDQGRECVTYGVVSKRPESRLIRAEVLPTSVGGVETDVVQVGTILGGREYSASLAATLAQPMELVARVRPCPQGYSVGHFAITAGTLGLWVRRVGSLVPHLLSNSHVVANSGDARRGDAVLQPGPYDGGRTIVDVIASLAEWADIRYESGLGKKKQKAMAWRLAKWLPNAVARAVGCPNRLVLRSLAVPQPYPNEVDAGIATALAVADALPEFPDGSRATGARDAVLVERVRKWGRTTEITRGDVVGVEGEALVDYGGRYARFTRQVIIGPGGFSAPGDSGSAILGEDGAFVGLLFAGSASITLANRSQTVLALLGLEML